MKYTIKTTSMAYAWSSMFVVSLIGKQWTSAKLFVLMLGCAIAFELIDYFVELMFRKPQQ